MDAIAEFVADGGALLVIARGRDATEPDGFMPWRLTKKELLRFESAGLRLAEFSDYLDNEQPPVRRFRALFQRTT